MADYLDNNKYGNAIIVGGWILAALGLVTVALRIWSRRLKRQSLMLNDWFAVLALVINLALISHSTQAVVVYGLGKHADVVGEYNNSQVKKSLLGIKPEWAFANAFVKLSILHFYTVIFHLKWFRIAAYTVMVLAVLYSLAALLEIFLSCFPMPYLWDPLGNPGGSCINLAQSWLAVGLTNLIEDVLIILLPLPVLWRLKLDTRRKLALSAIFSLGIFIIAVTGVRIKVILEFDPRDASYGLGPITFWSILEPLLGVINCCLPVIQPAISALTGQRLWSKGGKGGPNIPYKWSGSSKHNGNKSRRMGPLDPMGKLSSTTDAESQDALYENHIRGSTHATHIGLGQIKQEKTVLETSKAIMVEQQWEVS